LTPEATWEDKLDTALSLKPTLSTSTLRTGEKFIEGGMQNLWSRIGIVLSDGEIESSYSNDAGTKAASVTSRAKAMKESESLEDAIRKRNKKDGYGFRNFNEIVVSNPEILGFYICLDDPRRVNSNIPDDLPPIEDILKKTMARNIPVLALISGSLYKLPQDISPEEINEVMIKIRNQKGASAKKEISNDLIQKGWEKIKYQNLKYSSVHIENRYEILGQILNKNVFDIAELATKDPFIEDALSIIQGKEMYYALAEPSKIKNKTYIENYEELQEAINQSEFLKMGSNGKLDLVDCSTHRSGKRLYFRKNNRIFYTLLEKEGTFHFQKDIKREAKDGKFEFGISNNSVHSRLERPENFLESFPKTLLNWKKYMENARTEEEKVGYERLYKRHLTYLYGFGLQASIEGDTLIANRVKDLISSHENFSEIEDFAKNRITPNGTIIITEEDLKID